MTAATASARPACRPSCDVLEPRRLFAAGLPRPDHVVVVVEENPAYGQVVGSAAAPYINSLAAQGASLTDYHGVTHPSQPNYLALFSGSTQGVTDNATPPPLSAPNLGGELIAAGETFVGYSQSLPSAGFTGDSSGAYRRKHNPWADFTDVPAAANQPFASFPADFSQLPTVAFVVPDQDHDMHDGTVAQADAWLEANLD